MSQTHITTCPFCDQTKAQKFRSEGIPEVKPDEPPPEAAVKFFNEIEAHVAKRHPDALKAAYGIGVKLTAMILLKNFISTDPGVHATAEVYRQFIHRLTLQGPHVLSNAWLQGVYRSMIEDSPTGTIRFEEFQRLRDLLLEEEAPEPAQIVRA